MASAAPKTAFEVRREATARMGFRMVQVEAFVRSRLAKCGEFPSLGEMKRELDFYDKAGALRSLRALKKRGVL